jgi:hypothetical protein
MSHNNFSPRERCLVIMLSFALILHDVLGEVLFKVTDISEADMMQTFGTVDSIEVCYNMHTAHLQIWYQEEEDDVQPVHVRTLFGYRDDMNIDDPYESDMLFMSDSLSDDMMNMFPRFLSYYSFRIDTHYDVKSQSILLQLNLIFFSGFIGDLSYEFPENEDGQIELDPGDLLCLFKIESGFAHPRESELYVPFSYKVGFRWIFYKYIFRMKRWARRAADTVSYRRFIGSVLEKKGIPFDSREIVLSYIFSKVE